MICAVAWNQYSGRHEFQPLTSVQKIILYGKKCFNKLARQLSAERKFYMYVVP